MLRALLGEQTHLWQRGKPPGFGGGLYEGARDVGGAPGADRLSKKCSYNSSRTDASCWKKGYNGWKKVRCSEWINSGRGLRPEGWQEEGETAQ